jgi:hypothetical protein
LLHVCQFVIQITRRQLPKDIPWKCNHRLLRRRRLAFHGLLRSFLSSPDAKVPQNVDLITPSGKIGRGHMTRYQRCVVIVGPGAQRARYLSEWLLAAAQVERLWKEIQDDSKFGQETESICMVETPDFEVAAIHFVARLGNQENFVFDLDDDFGNDFVLMVGADLFLRDQNVYRMVLPFHLSQEALETVTVAYAKTEDKEYRLRPEYLINTMPRNEALAIHLRRTSIQRFENGALWPANVTA